jgi:hypothetical protein
MAAEVEAHAHPVNGGPRFKSFSFSYSFSFSKPNRF